jgi:hypothetical protein
MSNSSIMMEKASKLGFSLHQTVLIFNRSILKRTSAISLIEYNWLND